MRTPARAAVIANVFTLWCTRAVRLTVTCTSWMVARSSPLTMALANLACCCMYVTWQLVVVRAACSSRLLTSGSSSGRCKGSQAVHRSRPNELQLCRDCACPEHGLECSVSKQSIQAMLVWKVQPAVAALSTNSKFALRRPGVKQVCTYIHDHRHYSLVFRCNGAIVLRPRLLPVPISRELALGSGEAVPL